MKVKAILIITILILSTTIISGCKNSKVIETPSKENDNINSETSFKINNSTNDDSKLDSVFSKSTDNNLIFKSELGFSMTFPSNWKDKYKIIEDYNSVSVYFKSSDPNTPSKAGLFFTIIEKNNSLDETMYDSIEGKKYITINNINYFIGGPTDIALSTENSDFNIFMSMNKERKKIIDTIKSLT